MLLNKKSLLTLTLTLLAASSHASTIFDFTNPGGTPSTQIGSGFGNALDFGDLTVTAWGTTGVPTDANSLLDKGQILRFGTGLGACNKSEGSNCNNPAHQVDNVGDDDLVMFKFDNTVDFNNIVIDPFGYFDRDVSFWIANVTPGEADLTGFNPFALLNGTSVFGTVTNITNNAGYGPLSINLSGETGNVLIFGGTLDVGSRYDNDRFKIASLDITVVPVPAAVWLFGSGLIGLAGIARRKSHS
jgi:hypothetical protein